MNQEQNFHFIVPVWGAAYTKLFVETSLPLLLTSGNLLGLRRSGQNRFVIATTFVDAKYLLKQTVIGQLKQLMDVDFVLIDGLTDITNAHKAMSFCYSRAISSNHVRTGKTFFVFLTPDSFWSDGTFVRLEQLADEGYAAVMSMGLRTNKENMVRQLDSLMKVAPADPAIPISRLLSIAFKNLHQMSRAHDWFSGEGFMNAWPSHVYWHGGEDRLIAHCFHLHPLMIRSIERIPNIGDTIDGDFLENLNLTKDQIYIARGNEDFIGIEMSPADQGWNQQLTPPKISSARIFAVKSTTPLHRHFFRQRIDYRGSKYQEGMLTPSAVNIINHVVAMIDPTLWREMGERKSLARIVGYRILLSIPLYRTIRLISRLKRALERVIIKFAK